MLNAMGVEILEQAARLHDHPAGMNGAHLVHVLEVQDAAAGERHGLAVIARARAARRDRHAVGVAGPQHLDHLRLVLRRDHEVGDEVVKPRLQHRRVPEKVARLLAHGRGVGVDIEMGERVHRRLNVRLHVTSP